MSDYVLVHYGVKGMKWGIRKNPEVVAARAAYKKAKKDYNNAYFDANNRRADAYSFSAKRRVANQARWENVYDKGKVFDSAQKAYTAAKNTAKAEAKAARAAVKAEKQHKEVTKTQPKEKGVKAVEKIAGTIGAMYVADFMFNGGKGANAVKRGAKYAKKAVLDKAFNASILDATGKVIYRYNM